VGARFGRVIPAMITPFTPEGELDVDGAVNLARRLVGEGAEGLVLSGTTGESPTLEDSEDWELWRAVAEAVTVPVIAGTGTNATAHAVSQTRRATECGVAGVLVVTPYYNRPSQAGMSAHFRAVAAATPLPVMLYDIPVRTGRKISTALLLELAREVPNIVAVKDAAGNPGESARVIAEAPPGFELYSGDDSMTLPLMAVGAVGVVSVCAHWTAPEMVAMLDAVESGDWTRARELNAAMLDSYDFESSDEAPNPVPTRAMLNSMGLGVGECRLPMGPTPPGLEVEAMKIHERLAQAR